MIVPDSVKLIVIMAGFFLYDSALLLYANEALMSLKKGKWRIHYGSTYFTIFGKSVFVANPFDLHRPLFRLAWYKSSIDGSPTDDLTAISQQLSRLAPLIILSAITQFVLLPLVLLFGLNLHNLIITAIIIYLCNALPLVAVLRNRDQFGMTHKQAAALTVECLLCPPITLNVIRRLSLARSLKDDLSVVSRSLLTVDEWEKVRLAMEIQVDETKESRSSADPE